MNQNKLVTLNSTINSKDTPTLHGLVPIFFERNDWSKPKKYVLGLNYYDSSMGSSSGNLIFGILFEQQYSVLFSKIEDFILL
jgi:hypothetical protein